MHLNELNCGETATLTQFLPEAKPFRRKLLALGLTPGTKVQLLRRAPLGCPLEILVRGFTLSLRTREAALLCVQRLDTAL